MFGYRGTTVVDLVLQIFTVLNVYKYYLPKLTWQANKEGYWERDSEITFQRKTSSKLSYIGQSVGFK